MEIILLEHLFYMGKMVRNRGISMSKVVNLYSKSINRFSYLYTSITLPKSSKYRPSSILYTLVSLASKLEGLTIVNDLSQREKNPKLYLNFWNKFWD
jgi:hypothetical protein